MFEVTNKRNMAIPTAVVAAVLMLCAAVLVCSPMSDATGEDLEGYGEVNEIAIAGILVVIHRDIPQRP